MATLNIAPNDEPQVSDDQLEAHRSMVLWLFLTTAVVVVLLIIALIYASTHQDAAEASILLIVVIAGALGGFVSCLRRLYAFEDVFPRKRYANLLKTLNWYLIAYSTIPPLVGMIAAAVIYVIFAAEVIKRPAFPQFTCENGKAACKTFIDFMNNWGSLWASRVRESNCLGIHFWPLRGLLC